MIKIKYLVKSLAIISLLVAAHIADATPGSVVATFPVTANFFTQNPKNSEIYASTPNSILVIDTNA